MALLLVGVVLFSWEMTKDECEHLRYKAQGAEFALVNFAEVDLNHDRLLTEGELQSAAAVIGSEDSKSLQVLAEELSYVGHVLKSKDGSTTVDYKSGVRVAGGQTAKVYGASIQELLRYLVKARG